MPRTPYHTIQSAPRVMHRLLPGGAPLQPKLAVGRVDDPLEREADRVAEQVLRTPPPNTDGANGGREAITAMERPMLPAGGAASSSTIRRNGNYSVPTSRRHAGICRPTFRRAGNIEHEHIELDYVQNVNSSGGAAEYLIPQSGPYGGNGYADIVDLDRHEIYEIKTMGEVATGVSDCQRYVQYANLHCPPAIPERDWALGERYPSIPPRVIPIDQDWFVEAAQFCAGVIVYRRIARRGTAAQQPATVPATSTAPAMSGAPGTAQQERQQQQAQGVPAMQPAAQPAGRRPSPEERPAWQRVWNFIRQVARAGREVEQEARRFFRENPDLVELVADTALAVIVGEVLISVFAPASAPANAAVIATAGVVRRVAVSMVPVMARAR